VDKCVPHRQSLQYKVLLKMKNVIFVLFFFVAVLGPSEVIGSNKYLPSYFSDISFGMSCYDVSKTRNLATFNNFGGFRIVASESNIRTKDIQSIMYYFGVLDQQPLYELIIEYKENIDVKSYAATLYGQPNKEGEWFFEPANGYPVKVWTFSQTLVIAAFVEDTEWWFELHPNENEEFAKQVKQQSEKSQVLCAAP
jgi:hypothetical protein